MHDGRVCCRGGKLKAVVCKVCCRRRKLSAVNLPNINLQLKLDASYELHGKQGTLCLPMFHPVMAAHDQPCRLSCCPDIFIVKQARRGTAIRTPISFVLCNGYHRGTTGSSGLSHCRCPGVRAAAACAEGRAACGAGRAVCRGGQAAVEMHAIQHRDPPCSPASYMRPRHQRLSSCIVCL